MALTDPYGQNHYLGRFANDEAAESFLTGASWPLTDELVYYDTTLHGLKAYIDGKWVLFASKNTAMYVSRYSKHVGSQTSSGSFKTLSAFVFGGTGAWGVPVKLRVVAMKKSGTGVIRVYDITNNKTIATFSGITNKVYQIKETTALANLPTGEAIWEVQGKKVSAQEFILEF